MMESEESPRSFRNGVVLYSIRYNVHDATDARCMLVEPILRKNSPWADGPIRFYTMQTAVKAKEGTLWWSLYIR